MSVSLPDMIAARRAWIVGQIVQSNPKLTREEAERIFESVCAKPKRRGRMA